MHHLPDDLDDELLLSRFNKRCRVTVQLYTLWICIIGGSETGDDLQIFRSFPQLDENKRGFEGWEAGSRQKPCECYSGKGGSTGTI